MDDCPGNIDLSVSSVAKLASGPLCDKASQWVKELWCSGEVANRLRLDFPHGPTMRVSHEAIYGSSR